MVGAVGLLEPENPPGRVNPVGTVSIAGREAPDGNEGLLPVNGSRLKPGGVGIIIVVLLLCVIEGL